MLSVAGVQYMQGATRVCAEKRGASRVRGAALRDCYTLQAGASITDALGAPLAFNQPRPRAFGVLATAPAIHAAAVARLADRARAAIG